VQLDVGVDGLRAPDDVVGEVHQERRVAAFLVAALHLGGAARVRRVDLILVFAMKSVMINRRFARKSVKAAILFAIKSVADVGSVVI